MYSVSLSVAGDALYVQSLSTVLWKVVITGTNASTLFMNGTWSCLYSATGGACLGYDKHPVTYDVYGLPIHESAGKPSQQLRDIIDYPLSTPSLGLLENAVRDRGGRPPHCTVLCVHTAR